MVYEELFANTILTVSDESNRDICYEFRLYASDSFFSFPNNLPPILTVCKMVREEALPHFSRAVILGVSQGDRLDDASIVNRHIREQYLNHIKVVYLSGNAEGAVSDTLLPKLEELHVFSRAWLDYWNVDYLCDHVRVQVGKWMYWEEIQAGEALRMREAEDRPISYKVLLHFLLKGKYCPKQIQFPCKQCCPQNDGSTSGTVAYDEFINYTEVSGQMLQLRVAIILTFIHTGMHLQLARHLSCGEEEPSRQYMVLRVPIRRGDGRHQVSNMT